MVRAVVPYLQATLGWQQMHVFVLTLRTLRWCTCALWHVHDSVGLVSALGHAWIELLGSHVLSIY